VPGREVRRLFDNVRDEVLEATGQRQQPFISSSVPGKRDSSSWRGSRAAGAGFGL
jgi:hypothetical protein